MDDLVIAVRQIAQYPPVATPSPSDALLIQQGGVGGNYGSTSPAGLLAALATLPATFSDLNLTGSITWLGSRISAWGSGSSFSVFDSDFGAVLAATATSLWAPGSMSLPNGTLTVGRLPINPMDVATAQYVTDNTVWTFNGRRGTVTLQPYDLIKAGGILANSGTFTGKPQAPTPDALDQSNTIATTQFVRDAWCTYMQAFLCTNPFVYTFNGRSGQVELRLCDITAAGGAPIKDPHFTGVPTVPDPRASDYSQQIANTRWVTWQIDAVNLTIQALTDVVNAKIDASAFATLDYVQQTYAPINSPVFTGYPQGPTAPVGTATGQLATTAFVMNAVAESVSGVATFNGRSGNVTLETADLDALNVAYLTSPNFQGVPTAPTAADGTNTNQIATTAFVISQISAIDAGVTLWNNRSGDVTMTVQDITAAGGAPIVSPIFTGVPAGPTAAPGTATTQLATTAFVTAAINAINTGVASFNGRTGVVTLTSGDISGAGGAPAASPALTGTPTAPTATPGTNTTQLATTAFVTAAVAAAVAGGVTSFNGRNGAVSLLPADVNALGTLTLSGSLTIQPTASNSATVVLNRSNVPTIGQSNVIALSQGVTRWNLVLGDSETETGANAGSNFSLQRYSDAGAQLDAGGAILAINRASGTAAFAGTVTSAIQMNAPNFVSPATASPNAALVSQQSNAQGANYYTQMTSGSPGGQNASYVLWYSPGNYIEHRFNAGSVYFELQNTGNALKPGGGAWADNSDARIKTVQHAYAHGLEQIEQLEPVVFRYKGNDTLQPPGEDVPGMPPLPTPRLPVRPPYVTSNHYYAAVNAIDYIGLIAQDAEGPMPELISETAGYIDGVAVTDIRQLDPSPLVFALINAVKELAARLRVLEGQPAAAAEAPKRTRKKE